MNEKLAKFELIAVTVTPKTTWTFVLLTSDAGIKGVGEATLTGQERVIAEAAERYAGQLMGRAADSAAALMSDLPFSSLPEAAFSSAVLQAMRDLEARASGKPLAALLGGVHRLEVPVYANINRRTLDRTPAGFAASARDALAAGHEAFKIAPFDGLSPALDGTEARPLIRAGIDRVLAVREAIGSDKRLMVDCHWRFRTGWALDALDALKPAALHWFECPIPETADRIPDLVKIRRLANNQGVLLAGLETAIRREGFAPFLEGSAYDVMMPDVKYAGGPDEMMRIAADFAAAGIIFSPHNPSGPVCHAHSLHICAAVPDLAVLETQFDETPLFDELAHSALPSAAEGATTLNPDSKGLGLDLDESVLEELASTTLWQASA